MMKRLYGIGLLALFVAAVLAGCSSTARDRRGDPSRGEPVTGMRMGSGKYYHFDDVLIPQELNYKQSQSFVYETPRFKAGSMVFTKWWLDSSSLIDFFTYNMERDNWKLLNTYRGKESFLNFSKPDKSCTIRIMEKWNGVTEVEIRVGPLVEKKM